MTHWWLITTSGFSWCGIPSYGFCPQTGSNFAGPRCHPCAEKKNVMCFEHFNVLNSALCTWLCHRPVYNLTKHGQSQSSLKWSHLQYLGWCHQASVPKTGFHTEFLQEIMTIKCAVKLGCFLPACSLSPTHTKFNLDSIKVMGTDRGRIELLNFLFLQTPTWAADNILHK